MIGKTIDVSVTSVLQTTAGKMIFGKWDERAAYQRPAPAPAAAAPAAGAAPAAAPHNAVETKSGQP
jgi:hypothetical protein